MTGCTQDSGPSNKPRLRRLRPLPQVCPRQHVAQALVRKRKTQSMISRTNTCRNRKCTFQVPFCTQRQHKQSDVSSCSCTVIYLLFDSHSLRAKSTKETRFQVKIMPKVNQNLHDWKSLGHTSQNK